MGGRSTGPIVIEKVCGNTMLRPWEQVIFSFIQIYNHINYYKYNNIEDKLVNYYKLKPNLSIEEKQNLYKTLFEELEEKIINNIQILEKYTKIIKQKELDNIINEFLEIYNKNISIERKNKLIREKCNYYVISSSLGLTGWVLAKNMTITEE